jgi:hypothetical protein
MADERLQGPETADLVAAQRGDDGRRAILDVFIVGLFVLTAAAAVLSVLEFVHASYADAGADWVPTTIVLCGLGVLWWLNRRGHTALAAWLCLLLILFATSVLLEGTVLDRLLIIYALPVVSAAFLLRPGASFLFAALSALVYIVTWVSDDTEPGFNYVSLFVLAGLSLVSYLVAAYWRQALDAQEEYRRELERDVLERERAEARLVAREEELEELAGRLESVATRMADAVIAAVELRDPGTASHQRRVAGLSAAIGRELRLSRRTIHVLRVAAAVHDVGMAAVPQDVLDSPGPLSEADRALLRRHPEAARPVLERLESGGPVADIVTAHHERLDGSGYPRGLAGDDIRLEARVIAVADSVDAMMSDRPHRGALPRDEALASLRAGSGSLYDPEVVGACLRVFEGGFTW